MLYITVCLSVFLWTQFLSNEFFYTSHKKLIFNAVQKRFSTRAWPAHKKGSLNNFRAKKFVSKWRCFSAESSNSFYFGFEVDFFWRQRDLIFVKVFSNNFDQVRKFIIMIDWTIKLCPKLFLNFWIKFIFWKS